MQNIIINNIQDKFDVKEELESVLILVVKAALSMEKIVKDVEVSIVLTDDAYIQELNKTYRKRNTPTDVLSFAMRDSVSSEEFNFDFQGEEPLGDIVISLERAMDQAKEYGHTFKREVGYLAVHGMLHLLGYDHQTKEEKRVMRQKEEEILKTIDLPRGI